MQTNSLPAVSENKGFNLLSDLLRNPKRYPDHFVSIPLDPELIPKILSRERIRLMREVLEAGEFKSIQELAARLGRDPTRVGRDLKDLEVFGLLELEQDGKTKRVKARPAPIILGG
ncbi:MAG TPA: hypothetical protein VI893_02155 [Thermoplasmata archaeon]|nr:hypothetical protein [Thermoplasmata archaeon]